MRKVITILTLAGLALAFGCRKKDAAETTGKSSATSEVLVRYHFVGTTQLANTTNAAKLKEIWRLPETQRFAEQTLQKLAHAPKTLYGDKITAEQDQRGAALLRPLVDDLLRQESFLQVRGPATRQAEWTLLVQLPADRLNAWGAALAELIQVWKLGSLTTNTLEGFSGWEVRRTHAPNLLRWVAAGSWLVLGVGQDSVPTVEEAVRRIKTGGRPVSFASGYWLETEFNLPSLVEVLDLSRQVKWPHAKLSVTGAGENLRSTMQIIFSEPVTGPLNPWRVPTNVISEPLISFTAMRGIAPWLENSTTLQKLGLKPVPNELYFWAQSPVPFQSFLTFPAQDVTNTLARIGERAPSLLPADWHERRQTQITWQPTNNQVFWHELLLITPYLRPARDAGTDFIVGGIFPPAPQTNPPPPELLSQFVSRNDLIYYDWEITHPRLFQWRAMAQLFATIAEKPQLTTNTAGLPWLMKVETNLGNTVTEITAKSPKEWSLVRKSHSGFAAAELVALTRWLESTNFPRLSFDLPPDGLLSPRKPPAKQ